MELDFPETPQSPPVSNYYIRMYYIHNTFGNSFPWFNTPGATSAQRIFCLTWPVFETFWGPWKPLGHLQPGKPPQNAGSGVGGQGYGSPRIPPCFPFKGYVT